MKPIDVPAANQWFTGPIGRYVLAILPVRWTLRIYEVNPADPINQRTRAMFIESHSADVVVHATAIKLAKRCRSVIQASLREEEWHDADQEFYRIIRAELEQWQTKDVQIQATSEIRTNSAP